MNDCRILNLNRTNIKTGKFWQYSSLNPKSSFVNPCSLFKKKQNATALRTAGAETTEIFFMRVHKISLIKSNFQDSHKIFIFNFNIFNLFSAFSSFSGE